MSDTQQSQVEVEQCMAEFTRHLSQIAARHSSLALLAALAEHVGGALQLFIESRQCTPEQAREVLAHAQRIAFKTS